jgi:lysophospholipase L1-like esterase
MSLPAAAFRPLGHALWAFPLIGLAAAFFVGLAPASRGDATTARCAVPAALDGLDGALPHTAERLRSGGSLTIVALGSSSTQGVGASRPERSYPSRLAALLQAELPGVRVRVLNRGVGGEMAPQMVARLDRDVLAERPDLVIWQLGTNSVLRDIDPKAETAVARSGIERIKAAGADVMMIDLQYAPGVLRHRYYRRMLDVLAAIAASEDVPLVRRFAMMRYWAEQGAMSLRLMLAKDRLHMADAGYDCLARQVARAILASDVEPTLAFAGP